ncbi:hypothetical protein [uncultured Tateyamaria sp.]|uniref:hypothetical protein n=1 Tax=uncultured Tateyamaria sp. TaxID=455651 RepID=UPI0026378D82|nr:hypothetical protein [uncultured Tateyamaria sp.]
MAEDPDATASQLSPAQTQFLKDFLGYGGAASGADGYAAPSAALMPVWRDARDSVGEQINALENVLRGSALPLFEGIAEKGLNGVTSGQLTAMQVALIELDKATGPARAAAIKKTGQAVSEMRGFLSSNDVLPLLDENPMGVSVSIRSTLASALDKIESGLVTVREV